MIARVSYALCGFILGACFPISALLFARTAGGALGTTDFVSYAAAAHALYPMYYAIDTAPLIIAAVGFFLGLIQDRLSHAAASLRRQVRAQKKTLTKVSQALEERQRWDSERVQHAFYDPITRLPNRALFMNRAEHALLRADGNKRELAVLMLNLDDFRTINDMLGHHEGNAVLWQAGQRFKSVIRRGDTLARFAADEYALLLDRPTSERSAVETAQRIIDALAAPMSIGERTVRVGVSVGIACGRRDSSIDTLLRDASLAMNEAKARGKGCLRVFRKDMHAALIERVKLSGDLQKAIAREEFFVLYQPIVDLMSESVVGMEALLRWNHPQRGTIGPLNFIKLAEDTNAIVPLGSWVLETACRQIGQWLKHRPPDQSLTMTVNVSPLQLRHHGFIDDVRATLKATGVPPESLVLEITETGLIDHTEENVALFNELKALGVRLAIDDFGTGYSSLSYLQRFPFDIIKIDKSFVDGVAGGGTDAAFARTIIALGGMLNMRVLAEGIEEVNQRMMLRELGCKYGQGYLFAQPLDSDGMAAMLGAPAATASAVATPAVAAAL